MSLARYSELLSESDYEVLLRVASANATFSGIGFSRIREDPELLDYLLASEDLYTAIFDPGGEPFVHVSPFLGFAVLMHRGAAAISRATFVTEWIGPRKRVPLFDTAKTKEVLHDPAARFFLAELLASFSRISSGVMARRVAGKVRMWRFSELDLSSLVDLTSGTGELQRLQIVKRIGDLSLLLAGVFPDYAGTMIERSVRFRGAVFRALAEVGGGHWAEAHPGGGLDDPVGGEAGGLRMLDDLAASCYSFVLRSNIGRTRDIADALERVASQAEAARRALNFVSDRYLFEYRSSWFGVAN